ncbi:ThiF family adenylyltransferase [Pseudomonas monteilii]|nr:ThiF family adenylyltransferase [Pseudomonas monteilii]
MDDLLYYMDGIVAGIVVPSALFSHCEDKLMIDGPLGIACASSSDPVGLHKALVDSGALVTGQADEVSAVVNLLKDPRTSRTASYLLCFAHQCRDVIADFANLHEARVMIVGCGGIGSALCMLLAGAGVRKFSLIDGDVVEESNLNRQLYWALEDVGKYKVDVLRRVLESRFVDVSVKCLKGFPSIDELCLLAAKDVDAAAITADIPSTLAREGWRLTKMCGIPVVSGGYHHHLCSSFHIVPGDWEEMEEIVGSLEEEAWQSLPSAIMPSYGPMNYSLAAILSGNLLASLAPNSLGERATSVSRWDSRGAGF